MNLTQKPLILIVDDNPQNLQVLGSMLRENDLRVAAARHGREALDYLQNTSPDLILLDIMMPELDGLELCRMLRKDPHTREIPVIFITALTDTEDKLRGFRAGGDDYVTKPFAKEEVLARVKHQVERRRLELELRQSRAELQQMNVSLERRVEERTLELRRVQSQMVMQEKMAAIGQLAAGLAHEINNPLTFVCTNFDTLKQNVEVYHELISNYRNTLKQLESVDNLQLCIKLRDKEETLNLDSILQYSDSLFSESEQGFERIMGIIRSTRNFSRVDQVGRLELFDLNKGIADTLVISRYKYKSCAEIVTDLGGIPHIQCVSQQINQMLLNLVINAAQAIDGQQRSEMGIISIRTWNDEDNVWCEISDDGPGIPRKTQSRIFEPFFTTKDVGKGTGLGLSISYDIVVNNHGGELSVSCGENGGTRFLCRLPIEGTNHNTTEIHVGDEE